jgi:hypothetical protein
LNDRSNWEQICDRVQERLWKASPTTVDNARKFKAEVLKCLTQASNERILNTKLHDIHKLLKLERSGEHGKEIFEILGGQRNFKRLREIPHFERHDGCWFDFAILIDQNPKPAQIIGFNFEIRFPENYSTKFLRFDLNLPGHNNEDRGIRFHVHPGTDDFMFHSPPMSPLEILNLFLYGLPIPKRPRSS